LNTKDHIHCFTDTTQTTYKNNPVILQDKRCRSGATFKTLLPLLPNTDRLLQVEHYVWGCTW